MPQTKYKNRNSKEIKFKKSHHGNNPKKEIPKKPLFARWTRSECYENPDINRMR